MARPKAFDRDQALRAAMLVFWKKGYESTSTEDLLEAMEIGRQSLYDTYGDKHRLYVEALRLYVTGTIRAYDEILRSSPSPVQVIENLLLSVANAEAHMHTLGCMSVNAICEFGQKDLEVAALGGEADLELLATLEQVLRDAKRHGEVAPDLDEEQAAQFLSTMLAGMRVRAKAGDDQQALRSVVRFALNSLL